MTPAGAARLSALFAASLGLAAFGLSLAITAGDYGDVVLRASLLGNFFLNWPLWALLISGIALFALTVRRMLSTSWDFAWRGAIASYLGVAVAASGYLFVVEVLGGRPWSAGGFLLVLSSLFGFTIIGGPALAGLLAALLRPKRLASGRRDRPEPERTDARRRLGYILFLTGVVVCLGLVASSALVSSRGGLEYNCLVSGPVPTEPPLAVVSEAPGIVEGSFTLWPIGRQCEWDRADGDGTVTVTSGAWGTTAFAAGGALLALVGTGVILASARRTSAHRERVGNALT